MAVSPSFTKEQIALRNFTGRRNSLVAQVMVGGDIYENDLPRHIATLGYPDVVYRKLFPRDATKSHRTKAMQDALVVGTMLRSSDEISAGDATTDVNSDWLRINAALKAFEGGTRLEALTLMLGYETADVIALSPEVVNAAFAALLKTGVQPSWATLMACVDEGIDSSLIANLMRS
jgi:hypothetical protein